MCGIFGSKEKEKYIKLYLKNKERGDYSYGGNYISSNSSIIHKSKRGPSTSADISDAEYYIGHTRAPTSSRNTFDVDCCHPFVNKKFVYAHNGILNTSNLDKQFNHKFNVDSKWLSIVFEDSFNINNLKNYISGTYAVWGVNQSNNDIYLFRGANPIYWEPSTLSFSSYKVDSDFYLLQEGKVYTFNPFDPLKSNISIIDEFIYKSPYFIPGE